METAIQLYNSFLKKNAEENSNGAISVEKLDSLRMAFVKLYKKQNDSKPPTLVDVSMNTFGNLMNTSTNLVFVQHPDHGHVCIGKQTGTHVASLTIHDILLCFNMKWRYSISHCIGSAKQSQDCEFAVEL